MSISDLSHFLPGYQKTLIHLFLGRYLAYLTNINGKIEPIRWDLLDISWLVQPTYKFGKVYSHPYCPSSGHQWLDVFFYSRPTCPFVFFICRYMYIYVYIYVYIYTYTILYIYTHTYIFLPSMWSFNRPLFSPVFSPSFLILFLKNIWNISHSPS